MKKLILLLFSVLLLAACSDASETAEGSEEKAEAKSEDTELKCPGNILKYPLIIDEDVTQLDIFPWDVSVAYISCMHDYPLETKLAMIDTYFAHIKNSFDYEAFAEDVFPYYEKEKVLSNKDDELYTLAMHFKASALIQALTMYQEEHPPTEEESNYLHYLHLYHSTYYNVLVGRTNLESPEQEELDFNYFIYQAEALKGDIGVADDYLQKVKAYMDEETAQYKKKGPTSLEEVDSLVDGQNTSSIRYAAENVIKAYHHTLIEGDIEKLQYVIHPDTPFYEQRVKELKEAFADGMDYLDFFGGYLEGDLEEAKEILQVKSEEVVNFYSKETGYTEADWEVSYTLQLIDGRYYIAGINLTDDEIAQLKGAAKEPVVEQTEGAAEEVVAELDDYLEISLGSLIDNYLYWYTMQDVDELSYLVLPTSAFYTEQKQYIESLIAKNIDVSLENYTITSIQAAGNDTYEAIVQESYSIHHPTNGTSNVSQTVSYTIELIEGAPWIVDMTLQ